MHLLKTSTQQPKNSLVTSTVCAAVLACASAGLLFLGIRPASAQLIQAQTGPLSLAGTQATKTAPAGTAHSKVLAVAKGKHARVLKQRGTFEHRWTAADGEPIVILNSAPGEPTPEERQRIEKAIATALRSLGDMRTLLYTSAAKQETPDVLSTSDLLKSLDLPELNRSTMFALAKLNNPSFRKKMEQMQRQLRNGELERRTREAQKALADAQMSLNSSFQTSR